MMRFRVTLDTTFEPVPADIAEGELAVEFLDMVLARLEENGAIDPDAGGALATGEVRISVVVEAPDPVEAFHQGEKQIRLALEHSGVDVQDWYSEKFIVEAEDQIGHLLIATG